MKAALRTRYFMRTTSSITLRAPTHEYKSTNSARQRNLHAAHSAARKAQSMRAATSESSGRGDRHIHKDGGVASWTSSAAAACGRPTVSRFRRRTRCRRIEVVGAVTEASSDIKGGQRTALRLGTGTYRGSDGPPRSRPAKLALWSPWVEGPVVRARR